MSLYTKDHAIGTLRVTSFDLDSDQQVDAPAKKTKQRGDFIYKYVQLRSTIGLFRSSTIYRADDMLAILFPHLYEDLEYLLPDEDDVDLLNMGDVDGDGDFIDDSGPVAGPSTLR